MSGVWRLSYRMEILEKIMSKCDFNDCGWCYAPASVDKNDSNGKCEKPESCPYRKTKPEVTMSKPMQDNVDHPKHYTSHPSGIECIQITEPYTIDGVGTIAYNVTTFTE